MHDRDGVEALLDRTRGMDGGWGTGTVMQAPRPSMAVWQSCSCPHHRPLIQESDGAGQVPQNQ